MNRRKFLSITGATAAGIALASRPALARGQVSLSRDIAMLERESGGRLGVSLLDLATGYRFAHHGDARFPMCSTFKTLLVAAVLSRVQHGEERLNRRIPVAQRDIVSHSPETEKHVGGTATVEQLCRGTIVYSDNAAVNLLLPSLGGTTGFTRFLRALGDRTTRLDREEPMMGEARPGDLRDTTSPDAMLNSLRVATTGRLLVPAQRKRLNDWLLANTTGGARLRAGFPPAWKVGDKTGTGGHGTSNDIAIAWRGGRAPLLVTAYLTESPLDDDGRNAILAGVARTISKAVG